MIEPGLYLHRKSGNKYRVLFVAAWAVRDLPDDDAFLRVWVPPANTCASVALAPARLEAGSLALFSARWSGNNTKAIYVGDPVVIYVALYDDGRISARPLKEFEEYVDVVCKDFRGQTHNVPRFERIGD